MWRSSRAKLAIGCILVTAVAALGWGFWFEPSSLVVRPHRVEISNWPEACDELRVLVLADLHVGAPHKGLDTLPGLVAMANNTKPDVVLLAGDYVIQGVFAGEFVAPEQAAAVLAKLKAKLGVYAVLGNHDWWLDQARVGRALTQVGIGLLEDANLLLARGSCRFNLVGISDWWEGPHDIQKALRGTNPDLATLAFTHNPDVFPHLPASVDFLVAGHTHGGQVFLPVVGRPIVPSDYGQRYAAGLIKENGRQLFVSTGVGTSILPVRFRVPPELSLLVISKPSADH